MEPETFVRMAGRWKALVVAITVGIASMCVIPFVALDGESAEASRPTVEEAWEARRAAAREESKARREKMEADFAARDARWAKMEADAEEKRLRLEEELAQNPPRKRRVRKVRRFQWESPAETRSKIWNVPEGESEDALLTALLRVCIAEADGNPQDCVGIWQVVKNNRRRSCDRGMIRRITECDDEGETMLSALRRHQRHVLGYIKARNKRAVWIAKLTLDSESPPEEFHRGKSEQKRLNYWDSRYQQRVSTTVRDARYLVKGELPPSRPGQRLSWLPGRPITWGGRCESGKASCDDRIACSRGLARIQDTDTLNAFWCRPGRPGCADDIDPICLKMGYPSLRVEQQEVVSEAPAKAQTEPQT